LNADIKLQNIGFVLEIERGKIMYSTLILGFVSSRTTKWKGSMWLWIFNCQILSNEREWVWLCEGFETRTWSVAIKAVSIEHKPKEWGCFVGTRTKEWVGSRNSISSFLM